MVCLVTIKCDYISPGSHGLALIASFVAVSALFSGSLEITSATASTMILAPFRPFSVSFTEGLGGASGANSDLCRNGTAATFVKPSDRAVEYLMPFGSRYRSS